MLSLIMATINTMDLVTNIFGVIVAGMGPVELGIMNALWTVAFIFAIRVANKLADKGEIRAQLIIALSSFILMNIFMLVFLYLKDPWILIYTYMVHALVFSFARTGISSYIHENYNSYEWNKILSRRIKFTMLIEAIYFAIISLIGINVLIKSYIFFSLFNTLLFFTLLLSIREPVLKIERLMYSLEGKLSDILARLNYFLMLSSIQVEGLIPRSFRLYNLRTIGMGLIITSLLAFRISNEYLLTPFPFYLNRVLHISPDNMVLIYGAGRLIAALFLFILSTHVSPIIYLSSLAIRILAIFLFLIKRDLVVIGLALGLIYFTNNSIDLAMYLTYVRKTGGYGIGMYLLLGEIGSLIGTLTSGLIFNGIGLQGFFILIMALSMLCMFIVRALG